MQAFWPVKSTETGAGTVFTDDVYIRNTTIRGGREAMDETPSRRRFLAAAGAALFAGCSGGGDTDSELEGRFDVNASTAVATTTQRVTTTADPVEINLRTQQTETLEPVETPDVPGARDVDDDGTPTRTSTPSKEERRATSLDDARSRLNSALSTYTGAGEGFSNSILDVRASTTQFDEAAVTADIEAAKRAIQHATNDDATPSTRVAELRAFASFLSSLTACQVRQIALYEKLDTAVSATFDEDFGTAEASANGLNSAREAAADAVDDLESDTDPSDTALVDTVSRREYARKIEQMRTEIDSTTGMQSPLANLREAMRAFQDGVESFAGGGDYAVSQSDFIRAQNGFEIADVELDSVVATKGTRDPIRRARSAAQKGVGGCESLISAAEAGADGRRGELREKRKAAIDKLGASAEIRGSPSYENLVDP